MNQNPKIPTMAPSRVPKLFTLSSLCTALITCNLANAQTTDTSPSEEELQSVERIVVTADLSQRDLSELPGSVNVLNQAIIEAEVFRYISDREVYNQLDNDVRVRSVLRRSDGAAEASSGDWAQARIPQVSGCLQCREAGTMMPS